MLLTADWHLTDRPQDEYRWKVFEELRQILKHGDTRHVVIAGDLTDRKDRHSAALVVRLLEELRQLSNYAEAIHILMGNHDAPLKGIPYWSILNVAQISDVYFYDKAMPMQGGIGRVLMLPWTAKPEVEWPDEAGMRGYDMAIIHQTVGGAIGENGQPMKGGGFPMLDRFRHVYSGDVHVPQKVGKVQYIGAPHHIKFGDEYPCRVLEVSEATFTVEREHELSPAAKELITIADPVTLDMRDYDHLEHGDQVKVRLEIDPGRMKDWPALAAEVHAWAQRRQVRVDSIEPIIQGSVPGVSGADNSLTVMSPLEVLHAYCKANDIPDEHLRVAEAVLEELTHG